jgi:PAS domain S-box-containing protein
MKMAISNGIAHLSFVCDSRGYVEFVNQPWLDYTGLTVGQSLGGSWRCAIHADDKPRIEEWWNQSIAECNPVEIETCLRRHDNFYEEAILNLMPLHASSGSVKQWHVATTFGRSLSSAERAWAETARGLQREKPSQDQYRTIIDSIPMLAWSTAKDGPAEFLNKAWLDYTGLSMEDAIGYRWQVIMHPDDLEPLFKQWMLMVRTGTPGQVEARMRRYDGEYRWFLIRGSPFLDSAGAVSKWFGVNIDIHDRKLAEAALQRMHAALSRANQLATVGELTASIAHEVNQPLAAVVANAEAGLQWIDRENPNLDGARKALQRIIRDGSEAGEVVARIRSLFRRAAPLTAEHQLWELVTEVLKLLEHETIRRRVSVDVAMEEALPAVFCDRLQIQQVLLNLIANAMDAMDSSPNGEKNIRVFANSDRPESLVLRIRDYGEGVQDPTRLFETFFTTKTKGLGMGLAISRSIIEAHGGELWLDPTDGPGSTFCFRLPVKGPLSALSAS